MRTPAAWWREWTRYSTTSRRATILTAVISAAAGLALGYISHRVFR